MIRIENHLGIIDISHNFLINLVGGVVVNCFGVVGMAPANTRQGIKSFFKPAHKNRIDRGVRIKYKKQKLSIDLHIIVTYGLNISALVKSIIHKVTYTVEETTGIAVSNITVFVDKMKTD